MSVKSEVRYLLCPGYVMSRVDNQYHHISAERLAKLYRVDINQCEIRPERMFARLGWRQPEGLVELHPRYDGDYVLPTQEGSA